MKKNWKKLMALMLALSMCTSMMTMPAIAADGTETVDNEDGTSTVVTTTTTSVTDETGNVTMTVEIAKATDGTTNNGVTIDRDETRTDTTVTDQDGNTLDTSWVEEGTELKKWDSPLPENPRDDSDVTVILSPGQTTSASDIIFSTTYGDVKSGEDDTDYDYTVVTGVDREVTATTSTITKKSDESKSELIAVGPEQYDGKGNLSTSSGTTHSSVSSAAPDGYDYRYIGYGDYSTVKVGYADVTYVVDEDGNVKKNVSNTSASTTQFKLAEATSDTDSTSNTVYGYCVDLDTSAVRGYWYSVANLEDNDYYASQESEDHIRAIVTNGYWGTSNEKQADGTYKTGSLASIKENLLSATSTEELDKVVATKGEQSITLRDAINGLTEGEALAVTQAAIWTYANGSTAVEDGEDGRIVTDPSHGVSDDESKAAMNAMYVWLVGLKTETPSEELPNTTANTVINEKNFVDVLSLTVGDKVAGVAANNDNNQDNDVYNAAMNFTLAVVPSGNENDDLMVQIKYKDLEGNDVVVTKRLAGDAKDGEIDSSAITPNDDGSYTLTGLQLSENQNFNFDLRLEGVQHLDQGVYVYTPEGGYDKSQSFVGIAEGSHKVDVSVGVTVKFDVDENDKIYAERSWHRESSKTPDLPVGPNETPETPEVPEVPEVPEEPDIEIPDEEPPTTPVDPEEPEIVIPEEEPPVVDIPDNEIALEDVPETGDVSLLALGLTSLLSGGGLVGLVGMGRKGKEND